MHWSGWYVAGWVLSLDALLLVVSHPPSCIDSFFCFLFVPLLSLIFVHFRWKNCFAGCHPVSVWRLNVYLCVPLDSCFEPQWRGDPSWFYFCHIHVGFNVGKLSCITIDGSLITQGRKLHADCFCDFLCFSHASHYNECMFQHLSLSLWIIL